MNKLIRILYIVLLAVSALLAVIFYVGAKEIDGETPVITQQFILWAYLLVGIATISAVSFPIIQMITNPQKAKKSLLGIAALAAVVAIAYFFSSGELMHFSSQGMAKFNVSSTLKQVDTGIITTYILVGIAIFATIYSEVSKMFK
jgi:ABC-type enterochelin transport system permease subunit